MYVGLCGNFFIFESALPIHMKCGSIHKGHLSLSWAPEATANPNPERQVLPGYFVLRMHVPEPFPKEGLGWKIMEMPPM